MTSLTEDLCIWMLSGLAGMVATVSAEGQPTIVRVWAVHPTPDRRHVDICIASCDADRTLADVAAKSQIALTLAAPETYRAIQLKGPCLAHSDLVDLTSVRKWTAAFSRAAQAVGMVAGVGESILGNYQHPESLVSLRLRIDALYDQTPGPGAGAELR